MISSCAPRFGPPPHDPSAACRAMASAASSRNQSCGPRCFSPVVRPTRERLYRSYPRNRDPRCPTRTPLSPAHSQARAASTFGPNGSRPWSRAPDAGGAPGPAAASSHSLAVISETMPAQVIANDPPGSPRLYPHVPSRSCVTRQWYWMSRQYHAGTSMPQFATASMPAAPYSELELSHGISCGSTHRCGSSSIRCGMIVTPGPPSPDDGGGDDFPPPDFGGGSVTRGGGGSVTGGG